MAEKNIVQLLRRRATGLGGGRAVSSCLNRRYISLREIADTDRHILNGHVVLGFSRCGLYLLSYLCEVTSAPPLPLYSYSLHWWAFNLHSHLTLVQCQELFTNERLHRELHLVVAQSADLQTVIVLGCRRSSVSDEQRPCCVSILPGPHHHSPSNKDYSIHFKFDLFPPFPSFSPSLSLRIPGCVLLNTGDSLVCINYSQQAITDHHSQTTPPHRSQATPPHQSHTGVSSLCQYFTTPSCSVQQSHITGVSPSHFLSVDVYCDGHPLECAQSADSPSTVCVSQSRLDVELWLNATLQRELDCRGYSFFSLNDYDLQLVEVCGEEVVFLLLALVEAQPHTSPASSCCYYSLHLVGCWKVSPLTSGRSQWSGVAVRLALDLRRKCYIPAATHKNIRAFSNHTVYTGKSLQALTHPLLPVTLVLLKHNTSPQLMNYS